MTYPLRTTPWKVSSNFYVLCSLCKKQQWMTTFVYVFCADYNNLDMVDGAEDGDEWQHNNTHTTTEPFPTSGTEVGDESQHNDTQTTREGKEYNPFIPVPPGDEPLCPGDVIFYWHDLYMCRNPMGERYATIQDGDPDRYPILRLDTMDPLGNMHRVKRIKVITWWSPAGQW